MEVEALGLTLGQLDVKEKSVGELQRLLNAQTTSLAAYQEIPPVKKECLFSPYTLYACAGGNLEGETDINATRLFLFFSFILAHGGLRAC